MGTPTPLAAIVRPFQAFFRLEAASGLLLLFCTAVALGWANSRYGNTYYHFWETPITVGAGTGLSKSLLHWINDALMAVFFLLVGLEIKREILSGELSTLKGAALPILGALGGMIVPAAIYATVAFTSGSAEARRGWAVPMATDIAFALGIVVLLKSRTPPGLKVFLAALAIADDLGAILVIAIFYTSQLSIGALLVGAGCLVVLIAGNRFGVRRPFFYALFGVVLWVAIYESGIHATIAGVLLAMTIPTRGRIDETAFIARSRSLIDEFAARAHAPGDTSQSPEQQHVIYSLERTCEAVTDPLQRFVHVMHPWVAFGIMPLFALANAGVTVSLDSARAASADPASIGTVLGLVFGKQIGVFTFAWIAVRTGLARLPTGATWPKLYGVACLCGIGFTMSLFIADLAFNSVQVLDHAKLAVLGASAASAILGVVVLSMTGRVKPVEAGNGR